jgi:hypothetical protein
MIEFHSLEACLEELKSKIDILVYFNPGSYLASASATRSKVTRAATVGMVLQLSGSSVFARAAQME